MNPITVVEDEVRELVRRRGLDPSTDASALRRLVDDVITDYDERTLTSSLPPLPDARTAARAVYDAVAGFGPLQCHLDDPTVEEIWINEPGRVFVARRGQSELTNTILTAAQVRDLVERMLKSSGRRVDLSTPFVDAMLPDGSRLHVVIPDITRRYWSVNVRKFLLPAHSLDELVELGTLTTQAARFLEASVLSGLNVIVAGGTQAGKTTLLNCLAAAIPARERVVTCEEVFELPDTRLGRRTGSGPRCQPKEHRGPLRSLRAAVPGTPARRLGGTCDAGRIIGRERNRPHRPSFPAAGPRHAAG